MAADRKPGRLRYPDPPETTNIQEVLDHLRSLIRVLEQNDVSLDAVLGNHATLIDDVTP